MSLAVTNFIFNWNFVILSIFVVSTSSQWEKDHLPESICLEIIYKAEIVTSNLTPTSDLSNWCSKSHFFAEITKGTELILIAFNWAYGYGRSLEWPHLSWINFVLSETTLQYFERRNAPKVIFLRRLSSHKNKMGTRLCYNTNICLT